MPGWAGWTWDTREGEESTGLARATGEMELPLPEPGKTSEGARLGSAVGGGLALGILRL